MAISSVCKHFPGDRERAANALEILQRSFENKDRSEAWWNPKIASCDIELKISRGKWGRQQKLLKKSDSPWKVVFRSAQVYCQAPNGREDFRYRTQLHIASKMENRLSNFIRRSLDGEFMDLKIPISKWTKVSANFPGIHLHTKSGVARAPKNAFWADVWSMLTYIFTESMLRWFHDA